MNLYAWKNSTYNATFWTDTENPTTSSHLYDSQGNDVTNTYVYYTNQPNAYINSASSSGIVYKLDFLGPASTYTATLPIGVAYSHSEKDK